MGKNTGVVMRFLIVDDHPFFRKALRDSIADQFSPSEFIEYGREKDFPQSWSSLQVDFAVIDLELFQSLQFDLIKTIHAEFPQLPIMVLSMYGDAGKINASLKAGARGFVTKHDPPDSVMKGIQTLLDGGNYLSERASAVLAESVRQIDAKPKTIDARSTLSKREYEVFSKLGEGLSRREIADQLNIALPTVESHIERIKAKLQVQSGHELTYLAFQEATS